MNALSVLVATVIVGAACIVWDRAAGAEKKISDNTENLTKLIDTLTDKLAHYEVQMTTMSNQLSVLINNQAKLIDHAKTTTMPISGFVNPKTTIPEPEQINLQQRAINSDMMKQFAIPKR